MMNCNKLNMSLCLQLNIIAIHKHYSCLKKTGGFNKQAGIEDFLNVNKQGVGISGRGQH